MRDQSQQRCVGESGKALTLGDLKKLDLPDDTPIMIASRPPWYDSTASYVEFSVQKMDADITNLQDDKPQSIPIKVIGGLWIK